MTRIIATHNPVGRFSHRAPVTKYLFLCVVISVYERGCFVSEMFDLKNAGVSR